MKAVLWYGSLALLLAGVRPVAAQDSAAWLPAGKAIGVTLDRFGLYGFHLTAATLHVTTLKPNHFTPEFAVAVFPEALEATALFTNVDLGGAVNLPLPQATLLLRGGLSGLFAFGNGGAGAIPALHYGASLLIKLEGKVGIRFDLVARRAVLPSFGRSPAFLSIGIGITGLPGVN